MKQIILKGIICGIRIVMSAFGMTCFTLMFTLTVTGDIKLWTTIVLLLCYTGVAAWLDLER